MSRGYFANLFMVIDSSALVAILLGEPLLFKGEDFSKTDIPTVLIDPAS